MIKLSQPLCMCPCRIMSLDMRHMCTSHQDEFPRIRVLLATGVIEIEPCLPCRRSNLRILVTGSRSIDDPGYVMGVLDAEYSALAEEYQGISPIVVQGGARGVDVAAIEWARINGFMTETHFPDYSKYGRRRAPHVRNAAMVSIGAHVAVGMALGESLGTRTTIEKAERKGIPSKLYEYEDGPIG